MKLAATPRRSDDRQRAARHSCAPPASANDARFPDFYETVARDAERAGLKHCEIVTGTGARPDARGRLRMDGGSIHIMRAMT